MVDIGVLGGSADRRYRECVEWLIICAQFYNRFGNCCLIKTETGLFFSVLKRNYTWRKNYNSVVISQIETWRELIVLWLGRTLLIIPVPVYVVTQSLVRKDTLNESLECLISQEICSGLLAVTPFLFTDKIRLVHPCWVATSTCVTQPP